MTAFFCRRYPDYWTDYMWLVICGAIMSFVMAAGIGANDVANSFGTSVGAKTITLKQACLIAAVFEFAGSIGLGGEVTKTIAGNIARPEAFRDDPELFAFGMLCALVAASTWVFTATYFCLAVSTTHSVIGAVLGFALVWKGKSAVVWNDKVNAFPYSKGLVPVVCSWFVSPLCAGISAAFLFFINRLIILRRQNSTTLAIYMYPVLVGITVFINLFFVISKGAKAVVKWNSNKAAWVSGAVSGGCVLLACVPGIPLLRWAVRRDMERAAQKAADAEANADKMQVEELEEPEPTSKYMKFLNKIKKAATHGLNKDIHKKVETDQEVHDMHAAAEIFNPETEQVYKYLQVFSACAVSFAHGANDVANAVGPFSGIWYVYRKWAVSSNGDTPYWVLALGGSGIVVGLATYGYNIMSTLGVGLAKMTPSRGYCAELATSFTVSLASVYGLPISTTQCITGAEIGVGLVESIRTGVNYKLFGKQILAWVFTLIVAGFLSAAFFAVGAYAPSVNMGKASGFEAAPSSPTTVGAGGTRDTP
ncbi:hypothetical protein VOLCADRAFT_79832 [Volvox carteri f. nagariensis]|uniref:Phosphate transporter n=1 Tax=Volvox carteri f. nagariensis TaxID=3068 RepID=D8TN25_VOLCA|nr:uncharacterized protein VOLCADRAFT_79832 [Volvox carteri f. nagariensis]EFJ51230.1 hypothetical protein VOLCADRAFT_79832 [Volvox carteri f. nagariensis]|eukprot:XP_002947697.1 hypothetical protein VOLCADRAFT_79832 [Volvox carteri f. nagariensis]